MRELTALLTANYLWQVAKLIFYSMLSHINFVTNNNNNNLIIIFKTDFIKYSNVRVCLIPFYLMCIANQIVTLLTAELLGCVFLRLLFSGIEWSNTHRSASVHYPWQKSTYLQERTTQLQNVLNELDPHQPVSIQCM